ncbi:hypothetical protein Q0M94_06565 [Deinococcus radiomollis]|uniref:hypothetical protein n=1 Tax=Deinococcus radiomollis TaxID=468916 RepID=UPI0038914DCA
MTEGGQADLAYRYLCTVGFFWRSFGLDAQELPLTNRVLALPAPEDRRTVLRALEVNVNGLGATGQLQAVEARLREILTLCQELGDLDAAAFTSLSLAHADLEAARAEQAWERVQQVLEGEPERMSGGFQTPRGRMVWPSARRAAAYWNWAGMNRPWTTPPWPAGITGRSGTAGRNSRPRT